MKLEVKTSDIYIKQLNSIKGSTAGICKRGVYKGAEVVADAIKAGIDGIPTEKQRYVKEGGKKLKGLNETQKQDLRDGLGIAPMKIAGDEVNTHIGFDGYGKRPTKTWENGVPNALLARAIESGTSFREKFPFIRKAVNASKAKAELAIKEEIEKAIAEKVKE